jgi:hypothetical protein
MKIAASEPGERRDPTEDEPAEQERKQASGVRVLVSAEEILKLPSQDATSHDDCE